MAGIRIAFRDGSEELAQSYTLEGGVLSLRRLDASSLEVPLENVDLELTLARNAGVEFTGKPSAPAGEPEGALRVRGYGQQRRGDYLVVEGIVENTSQEEQHALVARAIGSDEQGEFVTFEDALIEPASLAPGSEAPFRVVMRTLGRVTRARLEFRTLLGEPVRSAPEDPQSAGA